MSKKQKIIIFLILILLIVTASFFLIRFASQNKAEKIEVFAPVAVEITDISEEAGSEFDVDALGSSDVDMQEQVIIAVTNKNELLNDGDDYLTDFAVYSLQEYITRYITYYVDLDPGKIYEVEYVDNSYDSPSNIPTFEVCFKNGESPIIISCWFVSDIQRYEFFSSLNPQ